MRIQPMQRSMPSFIPAATSFLTFVASITAWIAVLVGKSEDRARYMVLVAGVLGAVCALLGLFVLTQGSGAAYATTWVACGIFAGLAIPTLLSVGGLFLIAVALALVAIARTRSLTGNPWWHPRFMARGYLVFAATLLALRVV